MKSNVLSKAICATFVRELSNRFRCEILLPGKNEPTLCYVPSSCHLSHFIDLSGMPVYVQETYSKEAKLKYSLLAVPYKRSYIALNENLANRAFENDLHLKKFSYLGNRNVFRKECYVDDYKCDFWLPDSNTVVEIKSVISTSTIGVFPSIQSERMLTQLGQIKNIINGGRSVCYYIISLQPYVEAVTLSCNWEYRSAFLHCVEAGMKVYGCNTHFKSDGELHIYKHIPVILE